MDFDKKAIDKLEPKEEIIILLEGGIIFDVIGGVLLLLAIILFVTNEAEYSLFILSISIVLLLIGIKNLLLKGEERKKYITSRLVSKAIKEERKRGKVYSKEEIEKIRFEYDPIFHDKIVAQVHYNQDNEYSNNVKKAEDQIKKLEKDRQDEIDRIYNDRWKSVANGMLKYNMIEGKIEINKAIHVFSDIKGAEVNKEDSYRVITTETGKSKKHASVGGAVAGGLLLGPVGAVVGGSALGKTTSKGNSVSNSIPTCNHIGVIVDIDGFKSEVTILDKTVDQTSSIYKTSLQNAEEIVSKLHYLAKQPVPKSYIKIEEEQSVLDINKEIGKAQNELKKVKENKPTYEIPEKYKL